MKYFVNNKPAGLSVLWLRELASLVTVQYPALGSISVAFVGEREMKRLNTLYRHKQYATDILSFRLDEHASAKRGSKNTDDIFGELILCYPVLKKQAREHHHSVMRECQIMVIHGTFHLLGHDHEKDTEARIMERKEKQLLKMLDSRLAVE